jgi:predicted Fe-Mo cluster-binding NifX family protein
MKVAIPSFGPRVSPRFDYAPNLLLFTVENGKVVERGEFSLAHLDPWQRVEQVQTLNIQALICGGIDGRSARLLAAQRIQVIARVAGETEEALKCFLRGDLKPDSFLCPGCRRRRVRMRKQNI